MTRTEGAKTGTTANPGVLPLLPECWLAAPRAVQEIISRLQVADVAAASTLRPQAHRQTEKFPGVQRLGVIQVRGPLLKYDTFWTRMIGGVSTAELRQAVAKAAADDSIGAILLILDTPGGEVAGTDDLALAVREAARRKPVVAYIEDMAASGGFYIASQASKIVMNTAGMVGSLGVLTVVTDRSVEFARAGIKVYAVASAMLKTLGVPGVEVTDEGIRELQRVVDGTARLFLQRVAEGRDLPRDRVRTLFDGRMFGAAEALSLGLVDRIGTLDAVIGELIQRNRAARREAVRERDLAVARREVAAAQARQAEELRAIMAE